MKARIVMTVVLCSFVLLVVLSAGNLQNGVYAGKVEGNGYIEIAGGTVHTGNVQADMYAQSALNDIDGVMEPDDVKDSKGKRQEQAQSVSDCQSMDVKESLEEETVSEETASEETAIEESVSENTAVKDLGSTEEHSEYANLAIADVTDYVNVRIAPNTDCEIVGKIYDGAVAQILAVAGDAEDWFQITSGNVEGYIKAEFFLHGDAAAEVIDEYVTRYAKVQADRLNVRKEPSTEAARVGYIDFEEKVKVLEDCGDWLRVQYTAGKEGYVSAEYVMVQEEFTYAKTLEEERAEIAARKALEARQNATEQASPEILNNIEFPGTSYGSNEELRKAIVDYALQYVGNKYVHGGSSLTTGTDCSGFTMLILGEFGYSISRTPGGQYSGAGRSIDYSEIQPGDIICYSSNGGKSCTHVAFYIGDGQIVHSANSRKGVIVSAADYSPIIGIRNVID